MDKNTQKEIGHVVRYGLISLFCVAAATASMCDKSEENIFDTVKIASVMGISLTALIGVCKSRV